MCCINAFLVQLLTLVRNKSILKSSFRRQRRAKVQAMADETPSKRREPTASEAMFFFAIVKHTRNKADIDWEAVAQEQNFKNAEVAKVRIQRFKKYTILLSSMFFFFLKLTFSFRFYAIGSLWTSQTQARHRLKRHSKEGQRLHRHRLDSQQGPQDAGRPCWS